ncbi:MAG: DUF2905 domain-containing protein [Candidatus Omnitrophota bacterium]
MINQIAKLLIVLGLFLVILGAVIYIVSKIPGAGKLPGDILITKKNFTFYFPLVTCLLISLILSLIMFLWSRR